jgi:hypothetical protein
MTTAIDEVVIVPAVLGTWAGAIGAAVHGAEQAAAATAPDRVSPAFEGTVA